MRRAAKVDDNQAEIVAALRRAGCSVCSLAGVGKGCPDLAVGLRGVTYMLEIKDGRKPPSKQRLTPDEQAWHDAWRGHATVVRSVDEALDAVGLRPVRIAPAPDQVRCWMPTGKEVSRDAGGSAGQNGR